MGIWCARQVAVFAMSTTSVALWLVVLLKFVSISPDLSLLALIVTVSAVSPALSMLEAGGRGLFRREYRMELISCLVMVVVMVALPFTVIYLYFVGECLRCTQSYWDGAFVVIVFAVPAAFFQNISYRIAKRVI
jgi:hypothetical protein